MSIGPLSPSDSQASLLTGDDEYPISMKLAFRE